MRLNLKNSLKNKNNYNPQKKNKNCKENKKNYLIKGKKTSLRKTKISKELFLLIKVLGINT
tara:strand:- start:192 stop:374 length:183 start_codon:yes stop_codon:yes gene_type:complete